MASEVLEEGRVQRAVGKTVLQAASQLVSPSVIYSVKDR